MQDLLEAVLPPDVQVAARIRPLLPSTILALPQESVWALPALVLTVRHSAVRAAAVHAALLTAVVEAAATTAVPSVLQLSYIRYIQPQVRERLSTCADCLLVSSLSERCQVLNA